MEGLQQTEFSAENLTREERRFKLLVNILKKYAQGKVTREALTDNNFNLIQAIAEIDRTIIIKDEVLEVLEEERPRLHADSFCKKYQIEDRLEEIRKSLEF